MGLTNVQTVITEWTIVAVGLPFVFLRIWVRCWQARIALSDVLIVASWLLMASSSACDMMMWQWGFWNPEINLGGEDLPDFQKFYANDGPKLRRALKVLFVSNIPYYMSLYCVKGSFLLFYMQLFPTTLPRLRKALYATIIFVSVGLIVTLGLNLFWCLPVNRNWETDPKGICLTVSSIPVYFITLAFHFFSDLMIYALPFFLLPHLILSQRKIISLVFIFSLGGVCIASTIGRTVSIGTRTSLTNIAIWGTAEQTSCIIVACCPPLKWLWHSRKGYGTGSTRSRTTGKYGTGASASGKKTLTFATMDPDDGYMDNFRLSARGGTVTDVEMMGRGDGDAGLTRQDEDDWLESERTRRYVMMNKNRLRASESQEPIRQGVQPVLKSDSQEAISTTGIHTVLKH